MISPDHLGMLAASSITAEYAMARGYETITDKRRLAELKITSAGRNTPGLLVPMLRVDGSTWGHQYRPDIPRLRDGKPIKYETPYQQRNGLDIPPGVADMLGDPGVPLFITEGTKKADCGAIHGLCIVALVGVYGWLHTNTAGGKMVLPEFHDIALNSRRVIIGFDGDIARKEAVQKAARGLAGYLATKGARVEYLWLPDTDNKTGLDDYLASHTVDELWRLVKPVQPTPKRADDTGEHRQTEPPKPQPVQPVPLDDTLAVFKKWLHIDDTAPMLAAAAAVVANLVVGDPVWLLIVGPPSGGKTEIISSCSALPYVVPAATLTEAALLSGTSKRERARDATGGLLRQIGDFGILLAKDFTSVLSQNRDTAKQAMAAMREIYDGRWDRPVGTDGGRVLHWHGKCGFIGGVTPSYDRYGSVVNALGDRYLLLRLPDVDAAKQARAALAQSEHEKQMRAELAAAMTGLIAGADHSLVPTLNDDEITDLVALASFAARARTTVERDGYTGELLVIPQPEGPARLIKALNRMFGALAAIGADTDTCWDVLARIALDCAPALRVPIMRQLLDYPTDLFGECEPKRTSDIAADVGMVTKTAGRVLDDLALLGIAERSKKTKADNSPDLWVASGWLREHWPQKVRQRSTTRRVGVIKEGTSQVDTDTETETPFTAPRTFLSHFDGDPSPDGQHGEQTDRAAANAAYLNGQCRDCHERPHSAGRTRCHECHRAWLITVDGYER